MRQILRLLHGGSKYDIFLILSLLKRLPTEPVSLSKRKEMAYTKCFGMGTLFSYSCKNTHRSARPQLLARRWSSMGTTWLQPHSPSKQRMRSNSRLPDGKPSGLKAISSLITSFRRFLNLTFVCWWSANDCKRTDRGFSEKEKIIWMLSWHADKRTEWGKAETKASI